MLIDCLHFLVYAYSISSCLPAEIVVECRYVLAVKVSPLDVEMGRLVALSYVGNLASVSGGWCVGTGTPYLLFSVT